jgi:hypothetical protein
MERLLSLPWLRAAKVAKVREDRAAAA